ncbi:NHLP bacteriocin system secretion protein [Thiorhodovibrio frisius]|uniref:NHLM bacteriocin system secretion protein n=1 Tax=Thiorhodovibrio frisius TaxID=631362 RepID=H8Z1L7_9GAMM|nr:NHLP bacteriocin system secretion protein [Thiorhodovibrio frisius]EIC21462.1 NHLM bacteriocin system secretion protein [Thiorhodovibrio frisius]WPL24048.1 multidrug efflux system protein EmrA [Thiorhodovibrio frisius]
MGQEIFRKSALERLSSPEQLDRLVTVVSPKNWVALIAIAVLLAAVVVWGILGALPTLVKGNGILISSGGQITTIQAPASGTLTEILVDLGQEVEAEQVLARISQTDAMQRLRSAKGLLEDRQRTLAELEQQFAEALRLKRANMALRREALEDQMQAGVKRTEFLRERLANQQSLEKRGLAARDEIETTRDELNQVEQKTAQVRTEIAKIEAEELDLLTSQANERRRAEEAVHEAERQIRELEANLAESTVVTSPARGIVAEVKINPGARVAEGQSLFSVQSGGQSLELILYVPPQDGKRVKPGMPAQVSPATARQEEFGTIKARVDWVSDFPASIAGMRAVLGSDELAKTFAPAGPPYVARVKLERAQDSVSGYRWTSRKGARLPLSAGTLCSAEITIEKRAPITLVIPLLRELTGIY